MYDGRWQFYSDTMDTLYTVSQDKLEPRIVFKHTNKHMPYNQLIDNPDELIGDYTLSVAGEFGDYFLFTRRILTKLEVNQFEGRWGGSHRFDDKLIHVSKDQFKPTQIAINDDIFHIFSEVIPQAMNWDGNSLWFALHPPVIRELLESLELDIEHKRAADWLKQFREMPDDANPVIFVFKLKDEFEI